MDWLQVIARTREWSDVPIIVLSVRDREEDKVQALDGGADLREAELDPRLLHRRARRLHRRLVGALALHRVVVLLAAHGALLDEGRVAGHVEARALELGLGATELAANLVGGPEGPRRCGEQVARRPLALLVVAGGRWPATWLRIASTEPSVVPSHRRSPDVAFRHLDDETPRAGEGLAFAAETRAPPGRQRQSAWRGQQHVENGTRHAGALDSGATPASAPGRRRASTSASASRDPARPAVLCLAVLISASGRLLRPFLPALVEPDARGGDLLRLRRVQAMLGDVIIAVWYTLALLLVRDSAPPRDRDDVLDAAAG
jgi:hypothetical protein